MKYYLTIKIKEDVDFGTRFVMHFSGKHPRHSETIEALMVVDSDMFADDRATNFLAEVAKQHVIVMIRKWKEGPGDLPDINDVESVGE